MIASFHHKGLESFYTSDSKAGILPDQAKRLRRRLDVMNQAQTIEELNVPGFDFHKLQREVRPYSIHVNGPWCLTFDFVDGCIVDLDYEQYH